MRGGSGYLGSRMEGSKMCEHEDGWRRIETFNYRCFKCGEEKTISWKEKSLGGKKS